MKRTLQTIVSLSAGSLLALTVLSQDTPDSKTKDSDFARDRVPHSRRNDRLNGAVNASDIIGMTVKNYQGDKLGKVEDLAVDVESGRVVQVLLSIGGFIGIGDTLTAVPPGALHHDVAQKVLHLDADREKLKNAPKFEMSKWAECCDSEHLSAVYNQYGEQSAFKFIHRGDDRLEGRIVKESQLARENELKTGALRTTDVSIDKTARRSSEERADRDTFSNDRQSMIPTSRLGHMQKASKLIGTAVVNLQEEKVGKLDNIVVDLASGRIVAVVVSSGGFLGLGDELSAVPPTALKFNPDRQTLQIDASKDQMSKAPHFKADQWPNFSQPSYADGVYRSYQVEPYFTTNETAQADNTVKNVRDRGDRTLTPLDQGNSKADVEWTSQIRKEIMATKSMSLNAKNVKIITKDGQVTLRGPVNTAEEKRLIGEIANKIARSENVDNQLDVKLTTSSNN